MTPPTSGQRTLLLISTQFFPAPVVAAVRWTHFARTLPSHGWKVVVLARYYGYRASPEQLAEQVAPGVEVRYIDHPADAQPEPGEPKVAQGDAASVSMRSPLWRLKYYLSQMSVPDASVVFWRRTYPRLLEEARRARPDMIMSTSPPFGPSGVALDLAKQLNVPVGFDFRDPFLIDSRYGPRGYRAVRKGRFKSLSDRMYREASLLVHVIPIEHRWARLRYPGARDKMREMTNGFPPTMLEGAIEPRKDPRGRRSIRVVGSQKADDMLRLAKVVKRLVDEGHDLALTLVGPTVASADEIASVLGDRADIVGRVEHREALGYILGADVLMNFLSIQRTESLLLSTKLFEYTAADKPIIEINPSKSDHFFVRRLPGLIVMTSPSDDDLAAALRRALAGEGRVSQEARQTIINDYTWPAKARTLARWFDQIVESRASAHP